MTHTVNVGQFEGPLGLLLELVERDQLAVTDISVAAITAAYLKRVQSLADRSPEELSEFLQLGARLLHIKSLALLPREAATEQAEALRQLNLELEEYRRFQAAARELGRRTSGSWARPVVSRLSPEELPPPAVTLAQLADAFSRAVRRAPVAAPQGIIQRQLTQADMATRLRRQLQDHGPFELQTLLDQARDRFEIIVLFLALLELMREGEISATQRGQFEPLMIGPAAIITESTT